VVLAFGGTGLGDDALRGCTLARCHLGGISAKVRSIVPSSCADANNDMHSTNDEKKRPAITQA
jgi:hypothetical protein